MPRSLFFLLNSESGRDTIDAIGMEKMSCKFWEIQEKRWSFERFKESKIVTMAFPLSLGVFQDFWQNLAFSDDFHDFCQSGVQTSF
jgi:hypothetical protein